jgi:hypothetical protein
MTNVSLSHRDVTQAGHGSDPDRAADLTSPPAQRLQLRRWRDPRLWLGVLLVVVAILAGATLFSSADDTVPVWAADDDVRAGMPLGPDDVHVVGVHIDGGPGADGYLSADQPLPGGVIAARDLAAGELLARSSVDASRPGPDRLPLAVAADGLPAGLAVGDVVDVWAVPAAESGDAAKSSHQVLDDVTVTSLGAQPAGGLDSAREVLVALPGRTDVGDVLDGLHGSDVVLVLVGE